MIFRVRRFNADPFSIFARLRNEQAVIRVASHYQGERSLWFVTRYAEAVAILKDSHVVVDLDSIDPATKGVNGPGHPVSPLLIEQTMIRKDGMDHTRLRAIASNAFTPRFIEGLRPRIQAITNDLLDQMQAAGSVDLVEDFAYPLPINVISLILGVPSEDFHLVRTYSQNFSDLIGNANPSAAQYTNLMQFSEYIAALVENKREHPG